jgi:hypothetical protein
LVYDCLPPGPVDETQLSPAQLAVLARLAEAERRLDELRDGHGRD